jgi:hypothetical protein
VGNGLILVKTFIFQTKIPKNMHVIRNAVGIVEKGRTTLEFDVSDEWFPFNVVKDLANPKFLAEGAQVLKNLEKKGYSGRTDLTTELPQNSYLRGFQGGLIHLVKMGNETYLVAPLRGADAHSSKLQLDIQAGRQREKIDGTWPEVILRYGFEIGMVAPGNKILIPSLDLFKTYDGLEDVVRHELTAGTNLSANWDYKKSAVKKKPTRYGEQEINVCLVDLPGAATFVVNDCEGSEQYSFKAGWAALPWVSSIEAIQVVEWEVPEGTRFYDTHRMPYDGPGGEQPVNRDIYLINCRTGGVQVHGSGIIAFNERDVQLSERLAFIKKRQERLQDDGKFADSIIDPISPKLRAAAAYLIGQHPRLQLLLNKY